MALKTRLADSHLRPVAWAYERAAFLRQLASTRTANRAFRQSNPNVAVPPYGVLRDATASVSFESYHRTGIESAEGFWEIFRRYVADGAGNDTPYRILEWGCGPARIVRHLPELARRDGLDVRCSGSDLNRASIAWAAAQIDGVTFAVNDLEPPTQWPSDHFDFVYSWSVFTHLSERRHHLWITELTRVLRPGGVLVVTTHGRNLLARLSPGEQQRFERGDLVEVRRGREGRLMYAAFHPEAFMHRLLSGLDVIEHREPPNGQDVWIVRRPTQLDRSPGGQG
jgi:SAM-dependent methyltransferase